MNWRGYIWCFLGVSFFAFWSVANAQTDGSSSILATSNSLDRRSVHENIFEEGRWSDAETREIISTLRRFDKAVEGDDLDAFRGLFAENHKIIRLGGDGRAVEYAPESFIAALPASVDIMFSYLVLGDNLDFVSAQTHIIANGAFFRDLDSAVFIFNKNNLDEISGIILKPIMIDALEDSEVSIWLIPKIESGFLIGESWSAAAHDMDVADEVLSNLYSQKVSAIEKVLGDYSVLAIFRKPVPAGRRVSILIKAVNDSGQIGRVSNVGRDIEQFSRRAVFEVVLPPSAIGPGGVVVEAYLDGMMVGQVEFSAD